MSFQLYFAGLACFIEQSASEYLVALPDGVTPEVDPCSRTTIHVHEPFLIIPWDDVVTSEIQGRKIDGCFVASLANAKTLSSAETNTGTLDVTDLADGHHWKDIDPVDFVPVPANALLTMKLKNGTLASQSVPFEDVPEDERSIFTKIDVTSAETGEFTLMVSSSSGNDQVIIRDSAEVLIANVAPEWIIDATYPDADDHFSLYYKISSQVGCKFPAPKVAPELLSSHPFLDPARSLRISCSNTIYP
jgi:hypothetical protein